MASPKGDEIRRVTRSNPGSPARPVASSIPAPPHSEPRKSLKEFLKGARQKKQKSSPLKLVDPLAPAIEAKDMVRGSTGIVFDEFMAQHFNPWDSDHIEKPDRLLKAHERCVELGLIEKCTKLQSRKATAKELEFCHDKNYLEALEIAVANKTNEELKKYTLETFHSVYMNKNSVECAKMAAGCAIDLTRAICDGEIQNGLALIRPPGHHAMRKEACGFCLCNNVAIAANYALNEKKAEKILIVDLDVHHGQATQYEFYDNPNVMYFSIHRYEQGEFWPHLRESNFDYIGGPDELPSAGKNVNVPLNKFGLGDADYMAIFQQVLIPLAYEFNPDLILVSAGFDAAIGCPEGQMRVTPAAYGHFINSLMAFAKGKIGVFLEGGYFIDSLKEGVAMSLRALLGEPCVSLGPLPPPDDSVVETILNLIAMQKSVWQCFNLQDTFNILSYDVLKELDCHVPALIYKGKDLYENNQEGSSYEIHESKEQFEALTQEMATFRTNYENTLKRMALASHSVALVYDEAMMKHSDKGDVDHPEQPKRIQRIFEKHVEYGLLDRKNLIRLDSRKATDEELCLVHDLEHVTAMKNTRDLTQKQLDELAGNLNSIYLNPDSYDSALLATGSLLNVIDKVCEEEVTKGVAIIRPPGHHAEADEACGFCIFNNVPVAAKYALELHNLKRILILDWDVHHGNGIQNMFYDDPRVLYISIHRYDNGFFFPCKEDANYDYIGSGHGKGYNINIPWNGSGMGDPEYAMAFFNIVLPVAYQFNPDLVLVSSGFDAARGDPLGRCKISPEFYGHMTNHLKALANGKIVVALEGGYNLNSISYSMTMVTKALLGDPLPALAPYAKPMTSAIETVRSTMKHLAPYWSCLKFGLKRLPDDMTDLKQQMVNKVEHFIQENSENSDLDYIPSQFGAYAKTFGIETLTDIKTAYMKKEHEESTKTAESKSYVKKLSEISTDISTQIEKLTITKTDDQNSAKETSVPVAIPVVSDREIFIPSEYAICGESPRVNTISLSNQFLSRPQVTKTTDSKEQK